MKLEWTKVPRGLRAQAFFSAGPQSVWAGRSHWVRRLSALDLIRHQSWLMSAGLSDDSAIALLANTAAYDERRWASMHLAALHSAGKTQPPLRDSIKSTVQRCCLWVATLRGYERMQAAILRTRLRRALKPFLPCPAAERVRHLADFLQQHPEYRQSPTGGIPCRDFNEALDALNAKGTP